jgi:hypothetical protein
MTSLENKPKSVFDDRFLNNKDLEDLTTLYLAYHYGNYAPKDIINNHINDILKPEIFSHNLFLANGYVIENVTFNYIRNNLILCLGLLKEEKKRLETNIFYSYQNNKFIEKIANPVYEKLLFTMNNYIYFKILKSIYARKIQIWYKKNIK